MSKRRPAPALPKNFDDPVDAVTTAAHKLNVVIRILQRENQELVPVPEDSPEYDGGHSLYAAETLLEQIRDYLLMSAAVDERDRRRERKTHGAR
jgi:hypothetical protein